MSAPDPRPDASMTLLTEMMQRPLDPGYAAAAGRREAQGLAPGTGTRSPLIIAAAVVIGFLLVVAAHALRPSGTTASRDKAQLIEQIQARQDQSDAQSVKANGLRSEVAAFEKAALGTQQSALADELARLGLTTGELPVAGPGLALTINDAPATAKGDGGVDPRSSDGFLPGRVTSLDLQLLTNGLWQAGAEAISINGQRLTARSAIRFAGEAILVDYRPLNPPYVISAIGDPQTLSTRFALTTAGSYLTALGDTYRIPSTLTPVDRVELPRSSTIGLTFARSDPTGIPSSSSTTPPGGTGSTTSTPPATTTAPHPPTSETTP